MHIFYCCAFWRPVHPSSQQHPLTQYQFLTPSLDTQSWENGWFWNWNMKLVDKPEPLWSVMKQRSVQNKAQRWGVYQRTVGNYKKGYYWAKLNISRMKCWYVKLLEMWLIFLTKYIIISNKTKKLRQIWFLWDYIF